MRILLVCPYYHPIENAPTNRLLPVVRGLVEAGHEVIVLAPHGTAAIAGERLVAVRAGAPDNERGPLHRVLHEAWLAVLTAFRLWRTPAPDVVVVSSPPFLVACAAVAVTRAPVVVDVRDLYPQAFVDAGLLRRHTLPYRVLSGLERWLYRRGTVVSTVTEGLAERIAAVTGAPPVLVRNGFDPTLFFPQAAKMPTFTVVVHGTVGRMQNVETLVEVARELQRMDSPIRIRVIGRGPGIVALQGAACENLELLGQLPKADLAAAVRRCHLALIIRHDDEVGRTAVPVRGYEAIGAGLPLVVAPQTELSALVERDRLGLTVDQCDPVAIAAALIRLASDRSLYATCCAAVGQARDRYSNVRLGVAFDALVVQACC